MIDETNVHEVHPGLADTIYVPAPEEPQEEQSVSAAAPEEVDTKQQQQQQEELADGERNFRELRRKASRLEQEKEQYRARLEQYESQREPKQAKVAENEETDIPIGDEDIVEGKVLKQFIKKQKALEAELKTFKAKSSEDIIESRIRARFPDYYAVVNADSLETLAAEDPELAYTIQSSQDFYNKAVLAYKEIKRRGIVADNNYTNTHEADKKKAQQNAAKPKPTVSASPQRGDSPLSKVNAFAQGLTPELKASLLKEMKEACRN